MDYRIVFAVIVLLISSPFFFNKSERGEVQNCLLSGGFYYQKCYCPPYTKFDQGACFIKTFEDVCTQDYLYDSYREIKLEGSYPLQECIVSGERINVRPIKLSFLWWIIPVFLFIRHLRDSGILY